MTNDTFANRFASCILRLSSLAAALDRLVKLNRRTKSMSDAKLRHAIAFEAARLMYERVESEYFTAKRKAAKRLCRGGVKPEDLPSNAEIREQIQVFARIHEATVAPSTCATCASTRCA